MDDKKENIRTKDEKRKTVSCRTCGAQFDAALPNCPYCGTMYLPAAETAYMNKLEGIRGDLAGLGALRKRETRAHAGRLSKKLLIAAAILLLAVAAVLVVRLIRERKEAALEQAEYLWQREGFARMDEYYDAGAYEDLVAFYDQAADEGHQVWQYRHWNFCEFYDLILTAQDSLQAWKAEGGSRLYLFYDEIKLYRLEYMNDLSPEERTMLDELRQPLLADFNERFPLTEAELDEFRRTLARNGFVSLDACERFFKERGWKE
jgi:hypothetical protein